jgi:predicted dehydrogenase
MMKKIRWGVIGAGGIALRRTIPEAVRDATNVELISVMDTDESKAKAAERPRAPGGPGR